jgi:hypothetical protein
MNRDTFESSTMPDLVPIAVELVGPEQCAVVGERDGRHPLLPDLAHQLVELDRGVEERVVRVEVQVNEALRHDGLF